MEWLKQLLAENNVTLTDEVMTKIQSEVPKHFVAKADFNAKLDELKGANDLLATRDADIEALKTAAGSSDELKNSLTALQTKYEDDTKTLKEQLSKTKLDSSIELALMKANAKNPKAVKALLDAEKITLNENGEIEGLTEQLDTIIKDNDYLFGDVVPAGTGKNDPTTNNDGPTTLNEAVRQALYPEK